MAIFAASLLYKIPFFPVQYLQICLCFSYGVGTIESLVSFFFFRPGVGFKPLGAVEVHVDTCGVTRRGSTASRDLCNAVHYLNCTSKGERQYHL